MCRAFSGVITLEGKVYWQAGIDSHEDLLDRFKGKDKLLKDDGLPATFCRFEIVPKEGNYLNLNGEWIFSFDDRKPKWWTGEFEKSCWEAQKKWKKKIYSSFNWREAKNPINPLEIELPKITKKHLKLLKKWDSVRDSVRASVRDSVRASVRASVRDSVRASVGASVRDSVWDSVWDSVRDSVRDSVGDSVRASVGAYIGSLFPNIKKWEYCDFKYSGYPFQSVVDLWKMGLVASYDGEIWRLHSKYGIEWEGTLKELEEK